MTRYGTAHGTISSDLIRAHRVQRNLLPEKTVFLETLELAGG